MQTTYSIPAHVRKFIEDMGYAVPNDLMKPYIDDWMRLYRAEGTFWDYEDVDGHNRYSMHRRTTRPFKRVCVEWSSLILGDSTEIGTDDEGCNEWLAQALPRMGFIRTGQALIQRTFAAGTGCWAVWFDDGTGKVMVRRYTAEMIVPLSWDDDGITEVALCSRVSVRGAQYDQVQLHLLGGDGYRITNVWFDKNGERVSVEGALETFDTHSTVPWFAVIKPAIDNDLVDMSPFGVSVYKDAVDALQSVDMAYDALMTEVDVGKLRLFVSDLMFEVAGSDEEGNPIRAIPFGKSDAQIYRQADMGNDKPIYEFAPTLRTDSQSKVYRIALQTMGDLCGFGLGYFDLDETGGLKTATEVSADNSQLMRNLKNHENIVQRAVEDIVRALIQAANRVGAGLREPETVTMRFDDSIITDTAAEKAQDLSEVNAGIMQRWEYRVKWYGEDEATARKNAGDDASADYGA